MLPIYKKSQICRTDGWTELKAPEMEGCTYNESAEIEGMTFVEYEYEWESGIAHGLIYQIKGIVLCTM